MLLHTDSDGVLTATQSQLAGHLGATREVIARVVSQFVDAGLPRSGRGSMTIINLFALRRVISPAPGPGARVLNRVRVKT